MGRPSLLHATGSNAETFFMEQQGRTHGSARTDSACTAPDSARGVRRCLLRADDFRGDRALEAAARGAERAVEMQQSLMPALAKSA